jgi:hypothetical protein
MKPTPTNVKLDSSLLQLMTVRPEIGTFVRKIYDLVHDTGVNGKGFSIVLVGDDLVIRLRLQ